MLDNSLKYILHCFIIIVFLFLFYILIYIGKLFCKYIIFYNIVEWFRYDNSLIKRSISEKN